MQLDCYFTLWGWKGTPRDAVMYAQDKGYEGVEGQCPKNEVERDQFAQALSDTGLKYIQEITTGGHYVPDRSLSLEDHLVDFSSAVLQANVLNPEFITCLGGCDAWDINRSLTFLRKANDFVKSQNKTACFETHRGRILFNPWVCADICERLPELQLTLDMSHWCVVCEGLQETEFQLIDSLREQVKHIHARVGYDQGAQVPQPFRGVYRQALDEHMNTWRKIWLTQRNAGYAISTITPEFGVDGYEYRSMDGHYALINSLELNLEMKRYLKRKYASDLGKSQSFICAVAEDRSSTAKV